MPRYADAFLDELRRIGDPSADAVIEELARESEERGSNEGVRAVNAVLRHVLDNDQPIPAELPPVVAEWLDETRKLPDSADLERIERATELSVRTAPEMALILATASLTETYAAITVAKVLTFSHRLDQDPYRRAGETAQFLLAVGTPGALAPGGGGIPAIQKVRLLHAAIRHLILRSGRWPTDELGVPICQEDMALVWTTFTWTMLRCLRLLGIRVREQEADDYVYQWHIVGEMSGIDHRVLPTSAAEAQELAEATFRRRFGYSPEGVLLTRALLEMHANQPSIPGHRALVPAIMRKFVGDQVADWLEIPKTNGDLHLAIDRRLVSFFGLFQRTPGLARIVNQLGLQILTRRSYEAAGSRTASFSIPVPAELQRRWAASGVFPTITAHEPAPPPSSPPPR